MTDSDSSVVEIDNNGSRIPRVRRAVQRSTPRKNGSCSNSGFEPVDIDSVVFLSSSQVVRDVILQFDFRKKNLVESIGFGGLLHLPSITLHDKTFSFWLLRIMKWFTASLCVGEDITLTMSAEHVGKIVGLPHTGNDVTNKSFETAAEKAMFVNNRLSFLHTQTDFVKSAQSFVMAPVPHHMSQTYIENFKVAFVIFVMGRFLAPGEAFDHGNCDFWGALEDADAIPCYNWSLYVLSNIRESARKMDWDIVRKKKLSAITCCTLILQIFYLDNVDFGPCNIPHTVFPRVKHYSNDRIARLIHLDMDKGKNPSCAPCYGSIQIIRNTGSCYNSISEHCATEVRSVFATSPQPNPVSIPSTEKEPLKRILDAMPTVTQSIQGDIVPLTNLGMRADDADYSSLISDNLQSQLGVEVLQVLREHQDRCTGHMRSFSESLRAAIAKENSNLASRLIDHFTRINETPNSLKTLSPLTARHISYGDTPEGSHYTPAGTRHKKMQRVNVLKSRSQSTAFGMEFGQSSSSPHSQWPDNSLVTPITQKSVLSSMRPSISGGNGCQESPLPTRSDHPMKVAESPDFKYNFDPPELPVELCAVEQSFSPTTENKIFNGISLSARQINCMQTIDLNVKSFSHQYSSSPIEKKKLNPGCLANSHWSLALEGPRLRDPSSCRRLFNWIASTSQSEELRRTWILHSSPRYLQIEGYQLRSEFVGNSPMTFVVFDSIIRRLTQIDRIIYSSTVPLRWRHMFESDFSTHAIADDHPVENLAVRDQFIGPDVDYDLCSCRMFFVPVLSNDIWWVYAFDMKMNTVLIIDPSNTNDADNTLLKKHYGTIQMIKDNLSSTVSILFSGWNPNFKQFNAKVFRSPSYNCIRSQSGFFTLFFISNFDGTSLMLEPSQANIQKFKEHLLLEILELEGNAGSPPIDFMH